MGFPASSQFCNYLGSYKWAVSPYRGSGCPGVPQAAPWGPILAIVHLSPSAHPLLTEPGHREAGLGFLRGGTGQEPSVLP